MGRCWDSNCSPEGTSLETERHGVLQAATDVLADFRCTLAGLRPVLTCLPHGCAPESEPPSQPSTRSFSMKTDTEVKACRAGCRRGDSDPDSAGCRASHQKPGTARHGAAPLH